MMVVEQKIAIDYMELCKTIIEALFIVVSIIYIIQYRKYKKEYDNQCWVLYHTAYGSWVNTDGQTTGHALFHFWKHKISGEMKLSVGGKDPLQHTGYVDSLNEVSTHNWKIINGEV
jgi:hypothetical protein